MSLECLFFSGYFCTQAITRHKQDGNVVISPLSVKLVLGMLMEGASGTSRNEIRRALRLPADLSKARDIAHSWVSALKVSYFQNISSAETVG